MAGWIKLHRQIMEWEWYKDGNTYRLFTHLLMSANRKDGKWKGHSINRGQLITGRLQLAEELGLSERNIRTALKHLETTSEITIKPTNKFSLITLINYDFYQGNGIECDQQTDQQADSQPTNNRPASDHKQEDKKIRIKEVKNYIPLGEFDLVKLEQKQFDKLVEVNGESTTWDEIENLHNYIGSTGKRYKDHYLTICGWIKKRKASKPMNRKDRTDQAIKDFLEDK